MTIHPDIHLRPAMRFAVLKVFPLISLTLCFLTLAWYSSPYFIFFSLTTLAVAWYRLLHIRSNRYTISSELIRTRKGILFRRMDMLEMYRIRDYVVTQPPAHQFFGLMNVMLKTTDAETPVLHLNGIPRSELIDTIRVRVQLARQGKQIVEIN